MNAAAVDNRAAWFAAVKNDAARFQAGAQLAHGVARIKMRFVGEKQAARKAPCQLRLKLCRIAPLMLSRHAGEARQLCGVARRGHHQRALTRDAVDPLRPPAGGALPQLDNLFRRALPFAKGRQHAARPVRRGHFVADDHLWRFALFSQQRRDA